MEKGYTKTYYNGRKSESFHYGSWDDYISEKFQGFVFLLFPIVWIVGISLLTYKVMPSLHAQYILLKVGLIIGAVSVYGDLEGSILKRIVGGILTAVILFFGLIGVTLNPSSWGSHANTNHVPVVLFIIWLILITGMLILGNALAPIFLVWNAIIGIGLLFSFFFRLMNAGRTASVRRKEPAPKAEPDSE